MSPECASITRVPRNELKPAVQTEQPTAVLETRSDCVSFNNAVIYWSIKQEKRNSSPKNEDLLKVYSPQDHPNEFDTSSGL